MKVKIEITDAILERPKIDAARELLSGDLNPSQPYQNRLAFGLLECSAGVSTTSVLHSISGETPDLHKRL